MNQNKVCRKCKSLLPNAKAKYCWNCGNEFHAKTGSDSEAPNIFIHYIFRLIRILRLDETVYSEIKSDRSKKAYVQAFIILFISASATMLGSQIPTEELPYRILLIFVIGIVVFRDTKSNPNWLDLVRVGGMASAPKVFQIIGSIPMISYAVFLGLFLLVTLWQVLAMTQGVKIIFNRTKVSFAEFLLVLLTLTPWIVIERFL